MPNGFSLLGTGVALGAVHVLTGPDHLSALATLSANNGSTYAAFCLGVRWGLGHSTGLLLVGIVCILVSRQHLEQETVSVPEEMTHFFETCIGVYMIALGLYGVHRAWNKWTETVAGVESASASHVYPQTLHFHDHHQLDNTDSGLGSSSRGGATNPDELSSLNTANLQVETGYEGSESPTQNKQVDCLRRPLDCLRRWLNKLSTQALALLTGILHGLAGPGGVLAVIPAVQLRDAKLATLYLTSFCVSSTLTMGAFAAIYGTCSSRLAEGNASSHRGFRIECGSAGLSLIVGILWLILLALGKLDEVFP